MNFINTKSIYPYMKPNFYTVLLIQLLSRCLFSQEIVMDGLVIDEVSQKPIEFVNIGIIDKNQGTITNTKGKFYLAVPIQFKNDSITISHINYHSLKIPIENFSQQKISLNAKTVELAEVIILNKKKKVRKIGVKSYNRLLSMRVMSENNDIVEAAQRIKIPTQEVKVKAINFVLRKWSKINGVKVRINFYESLEKTPQNQIVFKNIVEEIAFEDKSDWIRIDLDEKDIYITQDFFVGIEFIPDFENPTILDLGGILTKGKGYSRDNSLGAWSKLNGGASINVELEY